MTLVEAISKPDGSTFYSIEDFEIVQQTNPQTAKNGKLFTVVELQSGTKSSSLFLWDEAALWGIPKDTKTLRGTFKRNDFNGQRNITCENLKPPENAWKILKDNIRDKKKNPSIEDILNIGKRGYEWAQRSDLPEAVCVKAFEIASLAKMNGHPETNKHTNNDQIQQSRANQSN